MIRLSQMSLVSAILAEIDRQCTESGQSNQIEHYQIEAVIEGATSIVKGMTRERKDAPPGCGLTQWRASDDTGLSSEAMAYRLYGVGQPRSDHPRDPDDFGRCHRFLEAVPAARADLHKMWAVSPMWARLTEHWAELTALYLEELPTGSAPKLYALMKALGC